MTYELLESRIPREIYLQENRIGKEPDDLFELGATPTDHWRAHYQVVLTRQVMKHRLESREHDDIKRRTLSLGERLQPPAQIVAEDKVVRAAAMGLYRLTWTISRQIQHRQLTS